MGWRVQREMEGMMVKKEKEKKEIERKSDCMGDKKQKGQKINGREAEGQSKTATEKECIPIHERLLRTSTEFGFENEHVHAIRIQPEKHFDSEHII